MKFLAFISLPRARPGFRLCSRSTRSASGWACPAACPAPIAPEMKSRISGLPLLLCTIENKHFSHIIKNILGLFHTRMPSCSCMQAWEIGHRGVLLIRQSWVKSHKNGRVGSLCPGDRHNIKRWVNLPEKLPQHLVSLYFLASSSQSATYLGCYHHSNNDVLLDQASAPHWIGNDNSPEK